MAITYHTDGVRYELKYKIKTKRWIRKCIEMHNGVTGEIAFIFTSNLRIKQINLEYLNHHCFTDVITFDYVDGNRISGDIFISIEQVRENAEMLGEYPETELRRVMVHGILHLLGFSDSEAVGKRKMREKEDEALSLWLNIKENG